MLEVPYDIVLLCLCKSDTKSEESGDDNLIKSQACHKHVMIVVVTYSTKQRAMGDVVVWWKIEGVNRIFDRRFPANVTWNRVVEYINKNCFGDGQHPGTSAIYVRHRFRANFLTAFFADVAWFRKLSVAFSTFVPAHSSSLLVQRRRMTKLIMVRK